MQGNYTLALPGAFVTWFWSSWLQADLKEEKMAKRLGSRMDVCETWISLTILAADGSRTNESDSLGY